MSKPATTRLSLKGQVVIPEDVRKRLKLKKGSQFLVLGEDDVVILKAIAPLSMEGFGALIAKARRQAREAGMKKSDQQALSSRGVTHVPPATSPGPVWDRQ